MPKFCTQVHTAVWGIVRDLCGSSRGEGMALLHREIFYHRCILELHIHRNGRVSVIPHLVLETFQAELPSFRGYAAVSACITRRRAGWFGKTTIALQKRI